MSDSPVIYHVPGTDFAVIVATWDQAQTPVPAEPVNIPGVGPGVAYRTALDAAIGQVRRDGYEKVKQLVFSNDRDVVVVACKPRKAQPEEA